MTVVGIVVHPQRPISLSLGEWVADWLEAHGSEVRVPKHGDLPAGLARRGCDVEAFAVGLDLAVSLGGDGTMLRAIDLVAASGAPVLGVNVGHLGYLTEVEPEGIEDALQRLLAGDYSVDERLMLELQATSAGPAAGTWWALNDAVLEKGPGGHMVGLHVEINRAAFTTYVADGVIMATPTGSTAYSFSARGPIVSPRVRCMVLTPVSPHMLFDRPLVLAGDEVVKFTVQEDRTVRLIVDGRAVGDLVEGDWVSCRVSDRSARLVTLTRRDFHQVLKAKFGLPDR